MLWVSLYLYYCFHNESTKGQEVSDDIFVQDYENDDIMIRDSYTSTSSVSISKRNNNKSKSSNSGGVMTSPLI